MNKTRLLELADHIEQLPHFKGELLPGKECSYDLTGFNMAQWVFARECGTAMCIAGHTVEKYGSNRQRKEFLKGTLLICLTAGSLLELDMNQARALFTPDIERTDLEEWMERVTPTEASNAIRRLVDGVPLHKIWD